MQEARRITYLVFIRERIIFRVITVGRSQFESEIFFNKVKENKELRGDVYGYVAQAALQFDAEIVNKDHFQDGNYLDSLQIQVTKEEIGNYTCCDRKNSSWG